MKKKKNRSFVKKICRIVISNWLEYWLNIKEIAVVAIECIKINFIFLINFGTTGEFYSFVHLSKTIIIE